MSVPQLLEAAENAGERARATREHAKRACVRAVRDLERALVSALGGEPLRGQGLLAEGFRATRVRGTRRDKVLPEVDLTGTSRDVLVLLPTGRLAMAWRDTAEPEGYRFELAKDDELTIEDAAEFADALDLVLRRHLDAIARTESRFAACADLARRLGAALSRAAPAA